MQKKYFTPKKFTRENFTKKCFTQKNSPKTIFTNKLFSTTKKKIFHQKKTFFTKKLFSPQNFFFLSDKITYNTKKIHQKTFSSKKLISPFFSHHLVLFTNKFVYSNCDKSQKLKPWQNLKHRENCEKLPWEYRICCRGVKLFLLKEAI